MHNCSTETNRQSLLLYYFFLKRYNFGEVEGGKRRGDRTEGGDISISPVEGGNDDCRDVSGDGVCGVSPIQK